MRARVDVPDRIDDAFVLYFAVSGATPFFTLPASGLSGGWDVYGLAICRYDGERNAYWFYCDANWETLTDSLYEDVQVAMYDPSMQYDVEKVVWQEVSR